MALKARAQAATLLLPALCVSFLSPLIVSLYRTLVKGNFGYCPRASFLRRETGKVFQPFSNSHQYRFQIRLRLVGISSFSEQNKVTKMWAKYLLTRYYK